MTLNVCTNLLSEYFGQMQMELGYNNIPKINLGSIPETLYIDSYDKFYDYDVEWENIYNKSEDELYEDPIPLTLFIFEDDKNAYYISNESKYIYHTKDFVNFAIEYDNNAFKISDDFNIRKSIGNKVIMYSNKHNKRYTLMRFNHNIFIKTS